VKQLRDEQVCDLWIRSCIAPGFVELAVLHGLGAKWLSPTGSLARPQREMSIPPVPVEHRTLNVACKIYKYCWITPCFMDSMLHIETRDICIVC